MTQSLRTTAILLSLAIAGASRIAADPNYEVAGVVVDSRSHAALANVRVFLASTTVPSQKLEQITKQGGRFSFLVNQTVKYQLHVSKAGYPLQSYRQAGFSGLSSAIAVRGGQDTTHLVFEADREAVISGQIKDEDSEPVGNALVAVFQSVLMGGERAIIARGQTRANAAGEFRFSGLRPGAYYVCAMGRPWFADSVIQFQQTQESINQARQKLAVEVDIARRAQSGPERLKELEERARFTPAFSPEPNLRGTAFLTTFYPRGQTLQEASPIHLDAGGETQISITLPLAKAVSVKVKLSVPSDKNEGHAYLMKKIRPQRMLFLDGWVSKEGTLEFNNVPPGAYEILAASNSASGASSWSFRQDVEVGSSEVEFTLKPPPMGSVFGHVLFNAEHPGSIANLFITLRNEEGNAFRVQVDPEGNFSQNRIPAGRYELGVASSKYIAAFSAGASGEHMPLAFEINSSEPVRRDVMLTQAAATIEGTVERAGSPNAGSFVLLMPKDRLQLWAYRMDQTDSDGTYRLATIPAGDYFLLALSEGEDVAYRDPKVAALLAKAARAIYLEPNDALNMKLEEISTPRLQLPRS